MPAHWESSQRPLFVRTVWVDGSRHAILSPEDPLLVQCPPLTLASRSDSQANSSDVSSSRSSEGSSCDELAHCLIKLQLVLGNNGNRPRRKSARKDRLPRSNERPKTTHTVKCRDASEYIADKESRRASVASAAASMFTRYKRPFVPEIFHSSSEEELDEMIHEDDDVDAWMLRGVEALLPELSSNPLSERVLQWLDLAGKTSEEASSPCGPERPTRLTRRSVLSSAPGKTSVARRPCPVPATERRFSFPARTVDPESSPSEPLSVNARGMRTRRKRASLADNTATADEAWRREMARLATVRAATPPPEEATPLSATTCVDRGRTQLHIFMPSLPRDGGVRTRHRGDVDNGSESGTQWSELSVVL